jgi:hypothetical protein
MCAPSATALIGTMSDAQWQEIKAIFAERGVDLDTTMLGERFVPGKPRWLADSAAPLWPLRDVLQDIAWHYGALARLQRSSPTPIEQANRVEKEVATYEMALRILVNSYYADGDRSGDHVAINTALQTALTRKIAADRERIAKWRAMGSRSAEGSRTVHNDCWRDFAHLWLAVTGSAAPKRRQRLRRFLTACTRHLFPKMTAQEFGRNLDGFIDNFFR